MSDSLRGRVALVTGGARGIGRAICERLAAAGLQVAVNYRQSEHEAGELVEQLQADGVRAMAVQADVALPDEVERMVDEVSGQLGPVDVLVNNAGVFDFVPHDETTVEVWQRALDTNLTSAYHTIWAVKQGMIERGYGRIVNVASIAGLRARGNAIAYSVSKAGLIMLTKSFSEAVAEHGIRVNCVAPGLIDTEMPRAAASPEVLEHLIQTTPMKRIGKPEEIAKVVFFLLSDESDFMTGQTVVASGGRVLL